MDVGSQTIQVRQATRRRDGFETRLEVFATMAMQTWRTTRSNPAGEGDCSARGDGRV